MLKLNEMMSRTAIVSPRARPRPSMVPPMIPPRPKGSTTVRIMPHLVEPRAYADSRSPMGAWANTPRITAQAIGMTIRETQMPAMNTELTKRD